jgi:hypothetical protein
LFGLAQASVNELHVPPRRPAPAFRFLLKRMQDINALRVPQGVRSAVCIAAKILNHFKHACPAKSSQHFGIAMLTAALR